MVPSNSTAMKTDTGRGSRKSESSGMVEGIIPRKEDRAIEERQEMIRETVQRVKGSKEMTAQRKSGGRGELELMMRNTRRDVTETTDERKVTDGRDVTVGRGAGEKKTVEIGEGRVLGGRGRRQEGGAEALRWRIGREGSVMTGVTVGKREAIDTDHKLPTTMLALHHVAPL